MASLSDTYDKGPIGAIWTKKQLIFAVLLFAFGTLLFIGSVIAATTELLINHFEMVRWESWEIAGVMAGMGLPVLTVAVYTILPSSRRQQFGAGIGVTLVTTSVILFTLVFPDMWIGDNPSYTLHVTITYLLGALISLGFIFDAIANFRQRNSPGGSVTLNMEKSD